VPATQKNHGLSQGGPAECGTTRPSLTIEQCSMAGMYSIAATLLGIPSLKIYISPW
jgi:hypothetical protein